MNKSHRRLHDSSDTNCIIINQLFVLNCNHRRSNDLNTMIHNKEGAASCCIQTLPFPFPFHHVFVVQFCVIGIKVNYATG